MVRLFGLCVALLFASSVTAANIIDLGPSDYRNWGTNASHTGAGVKSSFGQTVRMPPLNTTLPVNRNAVIPYGSIANGMKNFVRITPGSLAASAAVTAAFVAMDWYFDQDKGEWVKDDIHTTDPVSGSFTTYLHPTQPFSTPLAACQNSWPDVIEARHVGPDTYQCRHQRGSYGNATGGYLCPPDATKDPETGLCVIAGPVSLTDSDFNQLSTDLANMPVAIPAGAGSDIMRRDGQLPGYHDTTITGPSSFTGPETTSTSTDPVTGDTIVTTTNTTTNISYGDSTITTTNTTTTTTYQNGQETSTTVTTETPGELPTSTGTASADWPKFCEWATVVCDWLNWTQEEPPPDVDLPAPIDEDFFEHKDISFGAKSCPPDHEINLAPFLPTTVGVSFQPLCDFAALIYYMVMAASYIIAAYISVGVARSA